MIKVGRGYAYGARLSYLDWHVSAFAFRRSLLCARCANHPYPELEAIMKGCTTWLLAGEESYFGVQHLTMLHFGSNWARYQLYYIPSLSISTSLGVLGYHRRPGEPREKCYLMSTRLSFQKYVQDQRLNFNRHSPEHRGLSVNPISTAGTNSVASYSGSSGLSGHYQDVLQRGRSSRCFHPHSLRGFRKITRASWGL